MMKTITVHQPYASLLAWGEKHYETRSWSTPYRGPIAIHAGKSIEVLEELAERIASWNLKQSTPKEEAKRRQWDGFEYWTLKAVRAHAGSPFRIIDFPRGSIVAIAELRNVHFMTDAFINDLTESETAFGYYSVGRYAWQINNVRLLDTPIPVKGQLGLWDWSEQS